MLSSYSRDIVLIIARGIQELEVEIYHESLSMTKLNFDQMTRPELRKYVLAHKQDEQAWEAYMNKPAKTVRSSKAATRAVVRLRVETIYQLED